MLKDKSQLGTTAERGFSLLELLIAMTISLAVMVAAGTLLASSLRTQARENTRSNALASAQRALGIMSREIANSGYGLSDNGILVLDSGTQSIRVRANLNNNASIANSALGDTDEDVRFVFQPANKAIVRVNNPGGSSVLATNITGLTLTYLTVSGGAATAATAERVGIDLRVDLPASPQQPATVIRLVSEVALRNAPNTLQQF
jgi:prepilin-type N-terminal cleavage/methylation domain-containing protein